MARKKKIRKSKTTHEPRPHENITTDVAPANEAPAHVSSDSVANGAETESQPSRVAEQLVLLPPAPIEIVSVLGRVGRYPQLKCTAGGMLIAKFSIATDESFGDDSGKWQRKVVWQQVVVWGENARGISSRLRTGMPVFVEGRLKTRQWTDRRDKVHTTRELYADELRFVDLGRNEIARGFAA